MPCAGPLLECLQHRQPETRNNLLDRKRVRRAVNARRPTRPLLPHRLRRRICHPDDEHPRMEVVPNFTVNLGLRVVLTADLDGEVGDGFQVTFGGVTEWEAKVGQERRIRCYDAIRVPPQDDSYFRPSFSEPPPLTLYFELGREAPLRGTVRTARRGHGNQPSVI